MSYYKIKNITGKLPKRHINKDMDLKIEYHVGFQKKYHTLGADNEIVLSCRILPVSIHSLRAKQLINVVEISENEFMRLQKPSAKKAPVSAKVPKKAPVSAKTETPKKKVVPAKSLADNLVSVVPEKEPVTKKKTTRKKAESTVTVKEEA